MTDPYNGLPSDVEPYQLTEDQMVMSPETAARVRIAHAMQTTPRLPVKREIPATLALVGCVAVLLAAWAVLA